MLITLISLIIAVLTIFTFAIYSTSTDFSFLAILMTVGGTAVLIFAPFIQTGILSSLQHLEQRLIPRLIELFRRNRPLALSRFFLFLFPLVSYVLAAALMTLNMPHKIILFAAWLVALGGVLDLIRDDIKRFSNFLNPFYLIELFTREAKKAIQDEKDETLWGSLDTLSEIALRSIEESKLALSTQALDAFPPIVHNFFAAAKSLSHVNIDEEVEKKTGHDEASYTIFYLLQRLQSINDRALKYNLETICSHIIVILGKIIVYSAQFDLSMVSFPIHFLGKFALKSMQYNLEEVANLATSTLLEISKTILTEIDLSYADLQEPFQAIIHNLDSIAKETFRKDKTVNIQVLMQPLNDLKAFFQTEKMADHRDTPAIIQNIDRSLAEFEALEQIMRTIPPIPNLINPSP